MDVWATKDHYERETEEAERLVRKSPKVKPPRHDRRRENIHDRDPDIDDDPDVAKDKDLSLNHKTIGGSIVERVVERHLGVDPIALRVVDRVRRADIARPSKLITVRLKENPEKTTQVTEETLKKEPAKYEVVKDEEKKPPKKEKKPAPKKEPEAAPAEDADDEEARAELEEKRKEREKSYGGAKKDEPMSEFFTGQLESGATTERDEERREKKEEARKKRKEEEGAEAKPEKPGKKAPAEPAAEGPKEAPADEKPGLQEDQPAAEERAEEDEDSRKQREADEAAFEAGETIRGLAAKDEWLHGVLDSIAKRNGPLGKRLRKNPHESLKSILGARFTHENWPREIETLGDLHRALTTEKPEEPEEAPQAGEKPAEEPAKGEERPAPGEPAKPAKPKIPAPKREPASAAEVRRATDYLKRTLPAADAEMLLARGIHPKDVNTLAATYEAAKEKRVDAKSVSKFAEGLAGHFQPDPEMVPPPKTWIKEGTDEEVPFDSLTPEEQAEAWQEHKMNVAALSIAGRQKVLGALQDAGLPEPLAMQVGKFLLSKQAGSDRLAQADKASEDLFTKHVAYGRAVKPVSDDKVAKILKAVEDPAARKVAAAYLQSQDYLSARNRFLVADSDERISEHEPPQTIAANIAKATKYLKDRARLYEGIDTGNVDAAAIFRARVEEQLRTLDPDKWAAVEPKLRQLDADDYKERARDYKSAQAEYDKTRKQVEAELKDQGHHPAAEERFEEGGERQPGEGPGGSPYRTVPFENLVEERLSEMGVTKPREPLPPPGYTPDEEGEGKKTPREKAKALWDRFFSRGKAASQLSCHWRYPRIVYDVVSRWAGYSSYPRGWTMGDLSADPVRSAVRASMKRHGVYWGVQQNQEGEGFPPYTGWQQAHARDLNDSDYDGILRAAREWLRTPILARKVDGMYRDTQLRAALDLAIRDLDGQRYSVGLHPTVYNHLLARLAGQSENETLLTERAVEGVREASSKSTYGVTPGEVSTMKASVQIRQFAARVASANPELAYDLIALASTVEAGEVPPQFKEHMKEKGDGQGQDQGQGQKDAAVKLANFRSLIIQTAAQHPEAREAFLPILTALKNG